MLSVEGFIYFLFIYDLFSDAVSVADYIALSGWMINER
jgi:hypothetical protein